MTPPRIFVHIPSYRDRECQWTVKDLFEKARHPERVFVGICWQSLPEEDQDCFLMEPPRPEQVRVLHFHIKEAKGLGWARQHARTLWQGEEYSLQIDSHMRFVPAWDEKMLAMLAACDSPDPVLTGYPPGYTPPDQLQDLKEPRVQCIKEFNQDGILVFQCPPVPAGVQVDRPLPTAACSGGFIFGPSRILRDVPFDADIYFLGEEPSLAVRLWTHGFDLFSPHEPVIYHYYKRVEGSRHWNDSKEHRDLHKRTVQRMRALCEPACLPEEAAALGVYGLGTRRSLAEYERFSGVNFTGKTLAAYARAFPYVLGGGRSVGLALDADLVPAPGLHLFILDDEGVLFSEAKGEFFRLNPSATFIWCAMEEGLAWPGIGAELAAWRGIAQEEAERELSGVATHWLGQGVLRKTGGENPAPAAIKPKERPIFDHPPRFDPAYFDFRIHHYRLLGLNFEVCYGDGELERWIHPVLAHLETDGAAAADQTMVAARILDYLFLYCQNEPYLLAESPSELAPVAKFALLDRAIRNADHILHLHAGAVVCQDRLVLLPAVSGSGKTSLTARLVAAGCEYFTDEAVLLERGSGRVRPAPLSLCIKNTGLEVLAPYFPGLSELPEHLRQDGIQVRYLPPPKSSLPPEGRALRPSVLVFPRYAEGAGVAIRPLSKAEAFGRLLDECVAIPQDLSLADAAVLMDIMEGLACYEMVSGDLGLAAEAVTNLCRPASMPPPSTPGDDGFQGA
jgi:hypothetical protein